MKRQPRSPRALLVASMIAGFCAISCRALLDIEDRPGTTGTGSGGSSANTGGAGGAGGIGGQSVGGAGGCGSDCDPEGADCARAIPLTLTLGAGFTDARSTIGGGTSSSAANQDCDGSPGPERVYAVAPLPTDGFLTARLIRAATDFDSVLYVKTECADGDPGSPAAFCADSRHPTDGVLTGGEIISFRVEPGQPYYLFVDGAAEGAMGQYEIIVDFSSGDDCSDPVPIVIEPGTPMRLRGRTNQYGDDGECDAGPASGKGADVVYELTGPNLGEIELQLVSSDYDTTLYARTACDSMQIGLCLDQPQGNDESITLADDQVSSTVPVYVWVDGSKPPDQGSYSLFVTPPPL